MIPSLPAIAHPKLTWWALLGTTTKMGVQGRSRKSGNRGRDESIMRKGPNPTVPRLTMACRSSSRVEACKNLNQICAILSFLLVIKSSHRFDPDQVPFRWMLNEIPCYLLSPTLNKHGSQMNTPRVGDCRSLAPAALGCRPAASLCGTTRSPIRPVDLYGAPNPRLG